MRGRRNSYAYDYVEKQMNIIIIKFKFEAEEIKLLKDK